ncbi:MAG TPA: SgcJ/EcaC family oxidoreductase [Casimicrobiaceae bacterium]|nr:SgcJ/EcaC family oxidoreductase [Casimicrobiaceae bacterium]
MNRSMLQVVVSVGLCLGAAGGAWAAARDDVAAAAQAWADAMNRHDAKQVAALYDQEAVLWGTRSPTLRDTPAAVGGYFKLLDTVPPSYKVVIDEQKIRVYGDIAIDTGRYTFSELHDDKPVIRPSRFSIVFLNRGGHWLIVDHHSSAVPAAH